MSWLAPPAPGPPRRRGPSEPRPLGRLRRVDLTLVIGCVVVVAASMLFWTGVVPSGLYPSSPHQWTLETPTCTYVGEELPWTQLAFPLWATVHVRWTATGGDVLYSVFNIGHAQPSTPIYQLGTSGGGSFFSDSSPYAFMVESANPPMSECAPIEVTTTVTYTL
jgi:hypothetical protein